MEFNMSLGVVVINIQLYISDAVLVFFTILVLFFFNVTSIFDILDMFLADRNASYQPSYKRKEPVLNKTTRVVLYRWPAPAAITVLLHCVITPTLKLELQQSDPSDQKIQKNKQGYKCSENFHESQLSV